MSGVIKSSCNLTGHLIWISWDVVLRLWCWSLDNQFSDQLCRNRLYQDFFSLLHTPPHPTPLISTPNPLHPYQRFRVVLVLCFAI